LFIPTVIVIEKALSAVCPSASVAVIVKLYVVSEVAPLSVPDITPEPELIDTPPGKVPDVFAKEVAPVAATVYEIEDPAAFEPKEPADVVHAGASETVSKAELDLTALPSLFSTLIK
jgi:hypothetical protein